MPPWLILNDITSRSRRDYVSCLTRLRLVFFYKLGYNVLHLRIPTQRGLEDVYKVSAEDGRDNLIEPMEYPKVTVRLR